MQKKRPHYTWFRFFFACNFKSSIFSHSTAAVIWIIRSSGRWRDSEQEGARPGRSHAQVMVDCNKTRKEKPSSLAIVGQGGERWLPTSIPIRQCSLVCSSRSPVEERLTYPHRWAHLQRYHSVKCNLIEVKSQKWYNPDPAGREGEKNEAKSTKYKTFRMVCCLKMGRMGYSTGFDPWSVLEGRSHFVSGSP